MESTEKVLKSNGEVGVGHQIGSLSVEHARRKLLEKLAQHPNTPASHFYKLYWFLKIKDYDWLVRQFPYVASKRLPTIQQDRDYILEKLQSTAPTIKELYRRSLGTSPGVRARIRDKEWMDQQLQKIQIENEKVKIAKRTAFRQLQSNLLLEALSNIIENENRPKRISRPQLSAASGMTHAQVDSLLSEFLHIGEAVERVNDDRLRRLLLWSIRKLKLEGKSLQVSDIYRQASLPATKEVQEELNKILITKDILI